MFARFLRFAPKIRLPQEHPELRLPATSYGKFHVRFNTTMAPLPKPESSFEALLDKFHLENSRLTQDAKDLTRTLKQLETLHKLTPEDLRPKLALSFYHPKTYDNKIALLELLQTPWQDLTKPQIDAVLDQLGVQVRAASMKTLLKFYAIKTCCPCTPEIIASTKFIDKQLKALSTATTAKELETIYDDLASSKYMADLEKITPQTASILAFMARGIVTEHTPGHLKFACIKMFNFPCKPSEAELYRAKPEVNKRLEEVLGSIGVKFS